MSNKKEVCIRVDSSSVIGTGHVHRTLTLARTMRESQHDVFFISRQHAGNINKKIKDSGFKLFELSAPPYLPSLDDVSTWLGCSQEVDARETLDIIKKNFGAVDLLVVDHYAIDTVWEQVVREHAFQVCVIDDVPSRTHSADFLIDQNREDPSVYERIAPEHCKMLVGRCFAILRDEFIEKRKSLLPTDQRDKLFIFFGGSDAHNVTTRVTKCLIDLGTPFETNVVVGSSFQGLSELQKLVASEKKISLHVDTPDIATLMSQSFLAIASGGTNTWERFCLGLPSVVISVAANQVEIANELHGEKLIHYLGDHSQIDEQYLRESLKELFQKSLSWKMMSERNLAVVDGLGKFRITDSLGLGSFK